jgi:hypothetical protein
MLSKYRLRLEIFNAPVRDPLSGTQGCASLARVGFREGVSIWKTCSYGEKSKYIRGPLQDLTAPIVTTG